MHRGQAARVSDSDNVEGDRWQELEQQLLAHVSAASFAATSIRLFVVLFFRPSHPRPPRPPSPRLPFGHKVHVSFREPHLGSVVGLLLSQPSPALRKLGVDLLIDFIKCQVGAGAC